MVDILKNKIKNAYSCSFDEKEFEYRANLITSKIKNEKNNQINIWDILSNFMIIKPQYVLSMIVGIAIGFSLTYQMSEDMVLYDNLISAAIYGGEYYG